MNNMASIKAKIEAHFQCAGVGGTNSWGFAPGYPESQLRRCRRCRRCAGTWLKPGAWERKTKDRSYQKRRGSRPTVIGEAPPKGLFNNFLDTSNLVTITYSNADEAS
jgi:hypothetical protein